jgi:hypothetical protein
VEQKTPIKSSGKPSSKAEDTSQSLEKQNKEFNEIVQLQQQRIKQLEVINQQLGMSDKVTFRMGLMTRLDRIANSMEIVAGLLLEESRKQGSLESSSEETSQEQQSENKEGEEGL